MFLAFKNTSDAYTDCIDVLKQTFIFSVTETSHEIIWLIKILQKKTFRPTYPIFMGHET